jgi:hypothetical protein
MVDRNTNDRTDILPSLTRDEKILETVGTVSALVPVLDPKTDHSRSSKMAAQVVATQPFAVEAKGREVLVHEGDVYAANDPVVKGRAHLFEPVPVAPAEKRRRS